MQARPFVKWVGSKRSIAELLLARFPERIESYYEPFVGGGSVFFSLANEGRVGRAYLSDNNSALVTAYVAIRDDVESVISHLHRHARRSGKEHYYSVRDMFNRGQLGPCEAAAAFIYLNRRGFNGLWRVNKYGAYNVPWGQASRPFVPDEEGLREASKALAIADIACREFDATPIDPNGFYYLDPPYDGAFEAYTSGRFGPDDHRRLVTFTRELDAAGARWLLSNADTSFTRRLYEGNVIEVVESRRTVSCTTSSRGNFTELLVAPAA